jgi:hypothetical protein
MWTCLVTCITAGHDRVQLKEWLYSKWVSSSSQVRECPIQELFEMNVKRGRLYNA